MIFYRPCRVGPPGNGPTREDEAREASHAGAVARRDGKPREVPYEHSTRPWYDGYDAEDTWIEGGGAEGFERRFAARQLRASASDTVTRQGTDHAD